MNPLRARLRIEQFEERINPTAVNIGHGTHIFTFTVGGYKVFQDNASFATTSSAFGFSEASMTKSQAADTLNGGTVMSKLNDAFDGYFTFGLRSGNPSVVTYTDSDGIVDITPAPTGAKNTTTPGTILTGSFETQSNQHVSFGGLELAQQNAVFAESSTVPIIRSMLMLYNPTNAPITETFASYNNLGSDANTTIYSTSNGDATFTPGTDTWIVSFQNFTGTTSPDPRILTVVQGPGAVPVPLDATSHFQNGNDHPEFDYTVTVNPGETKDILMFSGLFATRAAANAAGQNIFNDVNAVNNAGLLAGLDSTTLANVVNWDFSKLTTPTPPSPPVSPPTIAPPFAVGSGGGVLANAETISPSGITLSSINPFPGYNGPVSVATGDVNHDGTADLIVATGAGDSHVEVFSGVDGSLLDSFYAFQGFNGGVSVAAGDVNGDGSADIIVAAGAGGQSHVEVFSGVDLSVLQSFFAYSGYNGAVSVASADVNHDGLADIITGTADSSSHVKVFSGVASAELESFLVFTNYDGGVNVAAGDLNGDGFAEIVVGAASNTPSVVVFDGQTSAMLQSFTAFPGFDAGVRVGVNGSNILVAAGPSGPPHVELLGGTDLSLILSFYAFQQGYVNGIFVG